MNNGSLNVYLIGEAANYVDLGFIPNGSVFYSAYGVGLPVSEGRSVLIVDSNSKRTISKIETLLEEGADCVQAVWNASCWKDYSYAMLDLVRQSSSYDFVLRGTTAKLTVWNTGLGPGSSSLSIEAIRDALVEQLRTPSPLSQEQGKQLVEAYANLLKDLESQVQRNLYLSSKLSEIEQKARELPLLIEKIRELNSENSMLSQKNLELSEEYASLLEISEKYEDESKGSLTGGVPSIELDALKKQYVELQRDHSRLRDRYEALVNSKLGAFTIRRWGRKAKNNR